MDFIIQHTDLDELEKPAIIKTIVTSELGAKIAEKNDVEVFSTLTGFKYIGEKITQFERAKDNDDLTRNYDYLLDMKNHMDIFVERMQGTKMRLFLVC